MDNNGSPSALHFISILAAAHQAAERMTSPRPSNATASAERATTEHALVYDQPILDSAGNLETDSRGALNSTASTILSTESNFSLFPKLPIELRLKIWRHADDAHPRDIHVAMSNAENMDGSGRALNPRFRLMSPNPVTLQVCSESRYACSKFYCTCFKTNIGESRAIYLDPLTDTIYIQVKGEVGLIVIVAMMFLAGDLSEKATAGVDTSTPWNPHKAGVALIHNANQKTEMNTIFAIKKLEENEIWRVDEGLEDKSLGSSNPAFEVRTVTGWDFAWQVLGEVIPGTENS